MKKVILLSLSFVVFSTVFSLVALEAQDKDSRALHREAMGFMKARQYEKAIEIYKKILSKSPEDSIASYNTACAYSILGKKELALEFLANAIKSGYRDFEHMENDSDLDNIRNEPGYKKLVGKKGQIIRSSKKLAGKCGSEINWLKNFDEAKKQAAAAGKIIFCYLYYPGTPRPYPYAYSFLVNKGPLMDKGLIAFVNYKFIPLRLTLKEYRKIELKDFPYADKLMLLDGSVLLITPEGKVLKNIATTNPVTVVRTCKDILSQNGQYNKPSSEFLELKKKFLSSPTDATNALKLADLHIREYNFSYAKAILNKVLEAGNRVALRDIAQTCLKLAGIARMEKDCTGALEYISKTEKLDPDNNLGFAEDIAIEKGLSQIEAKQYEKALGIFSKAVTKYPKSTRLPEMYYWLSITHYLLHSEDKAVEIWEKMAGEMPDSRWSWIAAANLSEHDSASWEVARYPAEIDSVIDAGIEYLLQSQTPDGSWRVAGDYKEAVAAICCLALYEWQEKSPQRIKPALKKGISYLQQAVKSGELSKGVVKIRAPKIWGVVYALHFFSLIAPKEKENANYKDCIKILVKSLEELQRSDGGWSYHGGPSESFTTAPGIIALVQSEKTVEVPKELLKKALDCIKSFRKGNAYEYWKVPSGTMVNGKIVFLPERDMIEGCAARLPVCELSLFLNQEKKLPDIGKAMDVFFKYKERLQRVRKNPVYHVDKYWNAAYYFFFGYYYATLCTNLLSEELQNKYYPLIRKDILEINENDGGWVDHYGFSKPYGTAAALLILKNTTKTK